VPCPKTRVPAIKDTPLAKSRSRRLIFIPVTVGASYYETLRSVNGLFLEGKFHQVIDSRERLLVLSMDARWDNSSGILEQDQK
jgi:hypothetical protein